LLTPGESGMSRQSNEYTKSPFEVFPIGKHNTGLPTLSIGGAGARFGVWANVGDERSTNAKDAFFISTSRSAYYTTVLPYCILLTRTVVLLGNTSSSAFARCWAAVGAIADLVRAPQTAGTIQSVDRGGARMPMPRGRRPSTAALTRLGARKASEMVILTCRTLHFSRVQPPTTLGDGADQASTALKLLRADVASRCVMREQDPAGSFGWWFMPGYR
jgi:hypothetical protein